MSSMEDRAAVPVVVVARQNLHLTKLCIGSILAQDVPVEVLLVSNACDDGTDQWAATKPITVIHTGEQWSLAKCWNVALAALWKAGWNRAIVCNNDIVVQPMTARILDAMQMPFVSCISVGTPEQLEPRSEAQIEALRMGARPHPDYSCWMIRKSVTDRGIWFNEECWPAYVEDTFHHKAMHDAGIPAMCIDLPYLHHSSSTLKSASVREQAIIRRGADENRKRFRDKYGCVPGEPAYEALFQSTTPPEVPPATATVSAHPENRTTA